MTMLDLADEDPLSDFSDASFLMLSVLYCLLLNGTPVYVGRSTNILARLLKHRQSGEIDFNQVLYRQCSRDLAPALEAELIRALRPAMNIASAQKVKRLSRTEIAAGALRVLRAAGFKRRY